MDRRQFLAASIAVSTAGVALPAAAQTESRQREYYLLRKYALRSSPQPRVTEHYFSAALIPALQRLGLGPVGAFRLDVGPDTPSYYLLVPGSDLALLAGLDLRLARDAEFMVAADPYWNATSAAPAFERIDASLLAAFEGWPKITPPASSAAKSKRIFQLRTYESPSNGDHIRKVEMFHSGEFGYFGAAGISQVFFGDGLTGSRTPSLTYMLSFTDMAELDAKWDAFRNNPDWKKLSANPRFAFDAIVSNISNQMLSPLECSQI
jgi:NIPSNAP